MNQALTQQRIRITFGKFATLRFIGHLDLAKGWERGLRRAQLPVEYTQGFNPRPRIQFAAALQVGVTSESEYLDVWLTQRLSDPFPEAWLERLRASSAPGLHIYHVDDVPINDPALPQQVTHSDYVITFRNDNIRRDELQTQVEALLALPKIERAGRKKPYDLRPRILALTVAADGTLNARLSSNERTNARPDELLDTLGLDAHQTQIHRQYLHLEHLGNPR